MMAKTKWPLSQIFIAMRIWLKQFLISLLEQKPEDSPGDDIPSRTHLANTQILSRFPLTPTSPVHTITTDRRVEN